MSEYHNPVLLGESIDALDINPDGIYADATFGGGGHSREILSRLSDKGRLIAFDRDSDAAANAPDDPRFTLIHNDFRFIHNQALFLEREVLGQKGEGAIFDGILADLGVSSHQFDTAERGFSFRYDAPLDMRMNTRAGTSAADIVNNYSAEDLERILRIYGEVDKSRKAAALIVRARERSPILTTAGLDAAIEEVTPSFAAHKFLAKVYQAFRIEVNHEMRSLEKFLDGAALSLKTGGRLAVITYHSLEDRMVKNFIRSGNADGQMIKDIYGRSSAPLLQVTRKPILPTEEEIGRNTRARSAKLRVAEKESKA